jgi:tetratricopeptide (TPR) repeat protein
MKKIIVHILTGIGIICCVFIVVISVMNVIRGYSVRGFDFANIALVAMFSLIFADFFTEKHRMIRSNIGCLVIIYLSVTGIVQGRHLKKGEHLYKAGKYQTALVEFQKETSLWYLHLRDNSLNESQAQKKIADTYGRLCQFDKMIPVYQLIIDRCPDYYADFATYKIKTLGEYWQWIDCTQPSDPNKFFTIACAYQMFNCPSKAIETYQKLLTSDVNPKNKKMAQEKMAELQDPNSLYNRIDRL